MCMNNAAAVRRNGLLNENLNASNTSHELLVKEAPEAPKTIQAIAIALDCLL